MAWLKKDDRFAQHRKIRRLTDGAYRLHDTALLACAHDETDGVVTEDDIADMQHGERLRKYVPALVRAGLWHEITPDSWQINDYLDYNPSRSELDAKREKARERQERWRKGRSEAGSEDSSRDRNAVTPPVVTHTSHSPDPTPPVPSRPEPQEKDSSSEIADATSRPEDERPDVEEILDHLEASIAANDAKVPTRGKKARSAIRLMIDRDGRTPDQIKAAIDFATGDEFWRGNILSAPKLREQFDKLRFAAQRDGWKRPTDRHERHQQFWEEEMATAVALSTHSNSETTKQLGAS